MSDKIEILMVLIPALPLMAALITGLLGNVLLKECSHLPVVAAIVASCVLSISLLYHVLEDMKQPAGYAPVGYEKLHTLWTWADVADSLDLPAGARPFQIDVTLRADPLTAMMLAMVTFVSSLVAIYAVGYMHGDPGYPRFFAFVALFVFSMTMLVSVSNFVLLYVFWEAVGLCSYLLIGFWYEKPEAAAAGKKAFLVNRVGDFAFAVGLFLIWSNYGTLSFHDTAPGGAVATADSKVEVAGVLGQTRLQDPEHGYLRGGVALAICLCLLGGACGKSAQFPLHVWLPDAMEGPTPVSALIHAATMVTAGVYMCARCTPLFVASPEAQAAVAVVGCFTALLAGLIALTQNDLKRVLAYSTVSQLGYMFLGVGCGTLVGITAGMFHLFTHAFFKALLFLSAGSVMHAMGGVVDMRRFGGLRRLLPWTHNVFWFGALALAGVFPFAGFFSKDKILAEVHAHQGFDWQLPGGLSLYETLYFVGLFAAFLTAVYTFRALFLTFFGPTRVPPEAGHHTHESPGVMLLPLVVLAFCALVAGIYFDWYTDDSFGRFLQQTPSLAYRGLENVEHGAQAGGEHLAVAVLSTAIALSGIGLAAFLYLGDTWQVEWLTRRMKSLAGLPLYQLSYGKFFFDQIYVALVVYPLRLISMVCYWLDEHLIDALVNLGGWLPKAAGSTLRVLQNGLVQFYALAMVLGVVVLIGSLMAWPEFWPAVSQ